MSEAPPQYIEAGLVECTSPLIHGGTSNVVLTSPTLLTNHDRGHRLYSSSTTRGASAVKPVKSYAEALTRILLITFFAALIISIGLIDRIPSLIPNLPILSQRVAVLKLDLPLFPVIVAAAVAGVFRMIKLHDRISDVLHLREHFDVTRILFPLAIACGCTGLRKGVPRIAERRRELMSAVFYPYVTAGDPKQCVGEHYSTMALEAWAGLWCVIEIDALLILAAIIGTIYRHWLIPTVSLGAVVLTVPLCMSILRQCGNYAMDEISIIASQTDRRVEVSAAFNALSD